MPKIPKRFFFKWGVTYAGGFKGDGLAVGTKGCPESFRTCVPLLLSAVHSRSRFPMPSGLCRDPQRPGHPVQQDPRTGSDAYESHPFDNRWQVPGCQPSGAHGKMKPSKRANVAGTRGDANRPNMPTRRMQISEPMQRCQLPDVPGWRIQEGMQTSPVG